MLIELSSEQKNLYISKITNELSMLRARAGLTQEKLANYIGISRQSYYAIENQQRAMSWSTFFSLQCVYSSITETEIILKKLDILPEEFIQSLKHKGEYLKRRETEISKLD